MKSQGRGETLPAEAGSLMAPQKGTRDLIPGAYEYVTSQGNAALQMRSRILRGEPILDYGGGHDVITKIFFFFFLRFYLFIHERDRDTGRGRDRLHAGSSAWDSIPGPQDHTLG